MGFLDDLKRGEEAERLVRNLYEEAGKITQDAADRSHDFMCEGEKIEVKRDFMESRTGNVAIEIWNSTQDKRSGPTINCDRVVYVFDDDIRVCSMAQLSALMKVKPKRTVKEAGDGNAVIALYPRCLFDDHSESLEGFLS